MPITVNVNNLSLCHKGSDGITIASAPDVCLTPPGPARVPYSNVAYSSDLAGGTSTVFADGGNSIAHKPSIFATSIGDEPGTAGGVTSGTFMKEASWLTFSADVMIEGQPACRLTDKMLHNHGNTTNAGGEIQKPISAADCKGMWDAVDAECKPIVNEPDHLKRNKMITQKYAELYKANPKYEWAGLAALVSRQAGCNMMDAQSREDQFIGGDDAKNAYNALGEANRNIFGDIYPDHRFFQLYGWEGVVKCGDYKGHQIPQKLKDAFKDIHDGKLRDGSDKIADYEQRVVVEKAVYGNKLHPEFAETLDKNEYWSSGWRAPLGGLFGAKHPQIGFSAQCGGGTPIIFDGTINNPNDRVGFYNKLMDQFIRQRDANPGGWSGMFNDIINWSKH